MYYKFELTELEGSKIECWFRGKRDFKLYGERLLDLLDSIDTAMNKSRDDRDLLNFEIIKLIEFNGFKCITQYNDIRKIKNSQQIEIKFEVVCNSIATLHLGF